MDRKRVRQKLAAKKLARLGQIGVSGAANKQNWRELQTKIGEL